MYNQQASLPNENTGLIEIEQYTNAVLPEDYEITEVLDDIIMAEYADTSKDGKEIMRNGIFIPEAIADQKAWRIGRVLKTGPRVGNNSLKTEGTLFIFPGDRGIRSIARNGRQIIFINESRIFGVCVPKIKSQEKDVTALSTKKKKGETK